MKLLVVWAMMVPRWSSVVGNSTMLTKRAENFKVKVLTCSAWFVMLAKMMTAKI